MIVNFIVNPIVGGWSPWDQRIGGSEECVVECSSRLVERGHHVEVFHNGRHGTYMGVRYRDRGEYLSRNPGVTVNLNYPDLDPQEPTLYWTSLYPEKRDLSKFNEVLVLSEWQKKNSGIRHDVLSIVPPGYNPQNIYPGDKLPKTVLYASSPDRGLSELLRVWPEVSERCVDAQLIITYGVDSVDAPNAICLGGVSSDEMDELYRTSDIWCHPCTGNELYCMTGVKAQVAGCVPIYYPHMALTETVKFGVPATTETLAAALIDMLGSDGDRELIRGYLKTAKFSTWDQTVDKLEAHLLKYD